jgi:hypothetical protein
MTTDNAEPIKVGGRYRHYAFEGIAVSVIEYPYIRTMYDWSEDMEVDEEHYESAVVRMVGDDAKHVVEVHDLKPLDEDDYCHECGQIGCTHDGRDRDD